MTEAVPVSSKITPILALAAGCVLLGWNLFDHILIADDAYISFRYLDHWLAGDGIVWNTGERVEGYTNLLWILFLAPLRVLGLSPESASLILGLLSLALLFVAVFRTANALGGRSAAVAACLFVAGSLPLARWTVSGLETTLFAALIALANAELACASRHTWRSSVAFGLACIARPNGVLEAAAAFLFALPLYGPDRGKRLQRLVILGALFVAFPAVQVLFRLAFYGDPLPNTFYAKLSGELPGLHRQGLNYMLDFLLGGGAIVLLLPLLGFVRPLRLLNGSPNSKWVIPVLLTQVVAEALYVVSIGGDSFEFHRFLAPVVPMLAVLAALGLVLILERLSDKALAMVPLVALALALAETGLAYLSVNEAAFRQVKGAGDERELLSAWLERRFPTDSLLAINAAGLVPYRTGFPSVDMLGLSDRHIARAEVDSASGGTVFVGHYKHDGKYVCRRKPDLVVTSGARLFAGRSADEAIVQAASNTFPGDREFLQAAECQGRYRPVAEELLPGRFAVVYVRGEAIAEAHTGEAPVTAEAWFRQGIALMQQARLAEAARAFEASLRLRPDHPITQTNLGYCFLDLHQVERAHAIFTAVVSRHPDVAEALFGLALSLEKLNRKGDAIAAWKRYLSQAKAGSPWADRARQHLDLLGAGGQ